jgi:thioester reductase-like protein
MFQVSWKPAESPASEPVAATWGILILASNSEWIATITTTCTQAGIKLVNVEDSQHAQNFDGIICLWDSTPGDHVQSRELMGKALTQLHTAADALSGQLLVWVTRQAVGSGTEPDDRVTELGVGPQLWGLMRTARSEQPHLDLRLIDVGHDATARAIKSALALKGEPEIAVRRESVLVPRLERAGPEQLSLAAKPFLRTDGAVLITGGLGHLGGCVAEWLISQHGVKDIVLVSRKGMETEGAEQTIRKLTAFGAKITAIACDVANATEIKQLMATFSADRRLRGVVHAAGLSDSGVLTSLTPDRCEKVIAPKANGAWLLHDATKHLDLDIFVLFSSVSGVLGMPGLANYAAANTYLDALAHFRRSNGLPATSVAFGMLGHRGGMASRLAQNTQSYLSQYGLDALSERQGLGTLATAMRSQRALTVAAVLDLGRVQRYYDEQNQPIPPLLSSLLQPVDRHRGPAPASDKSLQDVVADAPAAQRLNIVLETVRKITAIVLGFKSPREVDINRSLKAIGIDSLAAVQLRNRLASATGLSLSANIAFAHPSIGALGQALCDQLQASQATPPSSNASSSPMDELDMSAIRAGCVDEMFTFEAMDSLERPQSVFLTGSTGFVGAFILSELVKAGITVYCLVRATSPDEAASRVFGALRHYGLDDRTEKSLIRPVVGDISRPLLGLSSQDFDDLADVVDAICHSGGLVDWARPFDEYVGPNLVSTHEILRLASRGRPKAIHLVSTISTLPKHMGLNLTEQDLEYGYGTSKFLAERMVAAARWRDASATVYRLPYVTASSTTGHFRRDQGDFLHNLIIGCRELGCFPKIHADLHSVVPVDYVAKTIASLIVNDREKQGQDYDFRNDSAPTCNEFFNAIIGIDKLAATIVPFEEWKHKALAGAERSPGGSLAKISMVLDSYTAETAHVMFKGQKLGRNVLGVDEYPIPLMDERFIARYMGQIKSPGQL